METNHTDTIEKTSIPTLAKINYNNVKKASMIFRALNHKLRQQIISVIEEADKITVTEIYVKLRLEQSVASQHLAILRRAGLLQTSRSGKFIYYSVNKKRIEQVMEVVDELLT